MGLNERKIFAAKVHHLSALPLTPFGLLYTI
jgi:hypothetical protein